MKYVGTLRSAKLALVPFLLMAVSAGHAQSPDRPGIYYYNGNQRVELELSLDELAVLAPPGQLVSALALAGVAPSGIMTERPDGGVHLQFAQRTQDLGQLRGIARALEAPGRIVGAIAYDGELAAQNELRRIVRNEFSLKLRDAVDLNSVLASYRLRVVAEAPHGDDIYLVEPIDGALLSGLEASNELVEAGIAEFATPLIEQPRVPRLMPNDPRFTGQWHLLNTGQEGTSGNDINVVNIWDEYTGAGVNIAVTDTGVDTDHSDLDDNIRSDIDYDVQDMDDDPNAVNNGHGVSVAGVAAAEGNNATHGLGSAFDAGIVGLRLLDGTSANDSEEAMALGWGASETVAADYIHVNNNSWGPADGGATRETWGQLAAAAVADGIANGRGGRGTIYVWASGNGGSNDDVNYDGYASSRYTIAVAASGADGEAAGYSEPGASILVNAPGGNAPAYIGTTAIGGGYNPSFIGTSASAPLAAGVIALMLEANPNLGWRDVQHILVDTSSQNQPGDLGWNANGSTRLFHHRFGYGRVDAGAAVTRAKDWVPIETNVFTASDTSVVSQAIPDGSVLGLSDSIDLGSLGPNVYVEHVEVVFDATHTDAGDLSVELVAPSGHRSVLTHPNFVTASYSNWLFTSVAHWGEDPSGVWTLEVRDTIVGNTGTWNDWSLQIYAMQVDPDHIYVDTGYAGIEDGSPNRPLTSLLTGIGRANPGGTVHVAGGEYSETAVYDSPITLVADSTKVTLRAP